MALVGTTIACSDPKAPASQAAVLAELGVGACAALPPAQTTIAYGQTNDGGARVSDGEGDYEVICAAFEEGNGFRLRVDVSGGKKSIFVDGSLSPVTSDSDIGCLPKADAPEGHLAGPVTVRVTVHGRRYDDDDGNCWVSVGPSDYGNGKARGSLCCTEISGDTASNGGGIAGGAFVVENCDLSVN